MCTAVHFGIYYLDISIGYAEYKRTDVRVDTELGWPVNIYTSTLFSKTLYLVPIGHTNLVYLPLNLTITVENNTLILNSINSPPYL